MEIGFVDRLAGSKIVQQLQIIKNSVL
jgi:hypothetical protein